MPPGAEPGGAPGMPPGAPGMPPEAAPPQGAPPQAADPAQAAPPEGTPPEEVRAVLIEILKLPPEQALDALRTLFAEDPAMVEAIDQIEQLPPEEQAEALVMFAETLGVDVAAV